MSFGYDNLLEAIQILKKLGYKTGSIGSSTLNRQIPYVFIGSSEKPCCLVQASIHAREYITTPLVLSLIKYYTGSMGIYIVPMANPDGVELCQNNGEKLGVVPKDYLTKVNYGSSDFTLWKANARAVDLNVNFPADWASGAQNVFVPSPANYVGEYPASEVETNNLIRFTNKINPIITISYHAKGEVIYYGYKNYPDYKNYASMFSLATGYPLQKSSNSSGGYKDWFVMSYGRLGMTFEVGNNNLDFPLPTIELEKMVEQNKQVYNLLDKVGKLLWMKSL